MQSTAEIGRFPVDRDVIADAQADWYAFVLEELNGLGTMLRFRSEADGALALAAPIHARIREVVETLAWDAVAALRQTWAFVDRHLDAFDDAWGPYVVMRTLEPDRERVADWLASLGPEARAIIEETLDVEGRG